MQKSLKEIDNQFSDKYYELFEIQEKVFTELKEYSFDLSKTEITDVIANRMYAFWHFVNNNNAILERKVNAVAADFFTETCLIFIKSYFNGRYEVKSEVSIRNENNKIYRPDISIWHNDKLIAVIELKVSNGYKGKYIMDHLIEREQIIKNLHPNAVFAVIAFWNFFDPNVEGWNSKYIGLVNYHKTKSTNTGASVENLIKYLEETFDAK